MGKLSLTVCTPAATFLAKEEKQRQLSVSDGFPNLSIFFRTENGRDRGGRRRRGGDDLLILFYSLSSKAIISTLKKRRKEKWKG